MVAAEISALDPLYEGQTWDHIEKLLAERDAHVLGASGFDIEYPGHEYTTAMDPNKTFDASYPWEEKIEPFEKKASCSQKNWKHTCLRFDVGQQVATLTLAKANNNSIDTDVLDALQDAITDLQGRRDVRMVVVKAEGKMFSSGLDAKFLMSESDLSEEDIVRRHLQLARIFHFLQRLPQYTVALVQGSVMGVSLGLICACDMVIAVKGAFIQINEPKLGLVPTTAIPFILRRARHTAGAQQLLLAGISVSAGKAQEYGMFDMVVERPEELAAEAQNICKKISLCAPGAVASTKSIITNILGQAPHSGTLNYIATEIVRVRKTAEARNGLAAIQSKKKPPWAERPIFL